jgi:hypothetical protein
MRKIWLIPLIFVACNKSSSSPPGRSFYMGVTPWPSNFTQPAELSAYAFINTHCDIVSHHFDDGIPYAEAYGGSPMPAALQSDVQTRKANTAPGKTILLSVAALDQTRTHKAAYYTGETNPNDSVESYWNQLPTNDSMVVVAYINYISYLIDELQPSFVNYGVESNATSWDSTGFAQYRSFLSQVYPQLKAKYPTLPFFVSFIVNGYPQATQLASQLTSYTDYITLSAYPYTDPSVTPGGEANPGQMPSNYFTRFLDLAPAKPWAFAETGYIAKNLSIPSLNISEQGNDTWQNAYLSTVCQLCEQRKATFLIWFCEQDYDAGDALLKSLGEYQDYYSLWQDIGLTDSSGAGRPSYQLWLQWMGRVRN